MKTSRTRTTGYLALSMALATISMSAQAYDVVNESNVTSTSSHAQVPAENYHGFGGEYTEWLEDAKGQDGHSSSTYMPKFQYNSGRTGKWVSTQGVYTGHDFYIKGGHGSYHGDGDKYGDENGEAVALDLDYSYNVNYRYKLNDGLNLDAKAYIGGKHTSRLLLDDDIHLHDDDSPDIEGYEAFFSVYGKVGVGLEVKEKLYLEAGLVSPLATVEYSSADDNHDLLYPQPKVGYYAEAEYRFNQKWFTKAYVSEYNFNESSTNDSGFSQADTDTTAYGFIVGVYF